MTATTNIVFFGESGSGKSSIINMLSASDVAPVSNGVDMCTLENGGYKVDVLGKEMTLWDTSGLDDGEAGRVPNPKAIANLYELLRIKTGVNLLVFVTRPRIKGSAPKHWKLFHKIVCREQVPIVVIVTGLEEERDRESWWRDNKAKLHSYGMYADDHACITASRGKVVDGVHVYDEEFDDARAKVQTLLGRNYQKEPSWIANVDWFRMAEETTYEPRFFGMCQPKKVYTQERVGGEGLRMLVEDCGMSKEEAGALAEKLAATRR